MAIVMVMIAACNSDKLAALMEGAATVFDLSGQGLLPSVEAAGGLSEALGDLRQDIATLSADMRFVLEEELCLLNE